MWGRLVKITKDGNKVKLYVRTKNGKVKIHVDDFYPYFYVPDVNGEYVAIDGTRVKRVYCEDPSRVPELRSKYKVHYEADIPYTRRFLVDTGIKNYLEAPSLYTSYKHVKPINPPEQIPFRVWYVDVEVKADVLPNPNNPVYPLHSITIYDSYLKKYITLAVADKPSTSVSDDWVKVLFDNEVTLLKNLSDLVLKLDPDIFASWNVEFDYNYLINRYSKLGLKHPFEAVEIFDVLTAYKQLYKRKSYRLKSVAFEEGLLGENEARETYSPDMPIDKLLEYNKRDVEILVKLDEKYKLIDYYIALKEFVGVAHLEDAFSASRLIDTELLRLAREKNIVLPSRREVEAEEYEGAVVFEPPAGIYENVAILDMATYYPSIIISFNISPDTVTNNTDSNDVIRYNNIAFIKREGILPSLCKRFLQLRRDVENELARYNPQDPQYQVLKVKRDAVKFLVNAIYGYTAYENSRIFDVRLASTITAIGREGLLKTRELASSKGYNVLYGDTDSIMIQVPFEKVEELIQYLNSEVKNYFKEKYGLPSVEIGLKFELYADKVMFFGVKKRYVAHVVWEKGKRVDYFKYTGVEAIRSNESRFAQEFQKRLVELVLSGAGVREILEFINNARVEMRKARLIDIALNEGIHKPLHAYKTRPPHVRGAIYSNMYLKTNFKHGDRVYYLWVKRVIGYPPTDVIAFDVDTKLPEIIVDWDKMEEANIWQKARPILEALRVNVKPYKLLRWVK